MDLRIRSTTVQWGSLSPFIRRDCSTLFLPYTETEKKALDLHTLHMDVYILIEDVYVLHKGVYIQGLLYTTRSVPHN
jgi:hypothetical protein